MPLREREQSGFQTASVQGSLIRRRTTLTPACVANITTSDQNFTVVDVLSTDLFVAVNVSTAAQTTGLLQTVARVNAASQPSIVWVNPTAATVLPLSAFYDLLFWRNVY